MIWKRLRRARRYFFAGREKFPIEQRLFISSVIAGMFISSLATIVSLIISSTPVVAIVSLFILTNLSIYYYFARVKGIYKPLVIPLIIMAFISIFIIWVFDGGIDGSNMFVAFVILILSLIVVPEKRRMYIIAIFVSMVTIVYLIQLLRPDLIATFDSERTRWIDSFVTAIYSSIFIFFIIRFLHNHYAAEKKRAEEGEERLHQANADKDRFISILSHDLRSPFNAILGFSEVLSEEVNTLNRSEIEDIASKINKSARNTYNLLEDILLWARVQSSRTPFNPVPLEFKNICSDILGLLTPVAQAKKITINCSFREGVTVYADPDMFKTVLRNLVSNAIKFSFPGGTVTIDIKENPVNITIKITDNGTGIDSEQLSTLFDIAVARSTTGTAGETGTGLGLLLCKEFIERHNGHLWVKSEFGKGSEFMFSLPKPPVE
jgi:two-component system, sensor histidine kinase and response regulator